MEDEKLSQLDIGQTGIIESVSDSNLQQKLLEMGCTPGEKISVVRKAPFKGSIAISVSSYMLSLRYYDADKIKITLSE